MIKSGEFPVIGHTTIILLDNGPITLMVLSYDLDLDQLTTIADTVEGVDQPAWIAAGGVLR